MTRTWKPRMVGVVHYQLISTVPDFEAGMTEQETGAADGR
jgi:hypothetical protein